MQMGFQGWFLNQPHTGIGQHCLGLLRELAKIRNFKALALVPKPIYPKGVPRQWIHVLKPPFWLFHSALKKWWWENISVPQFFAEKDLDWEYYPYPCPLPKASTHLRAMTVHDTLLWTDPRYEGGKLKQYYYHCARRSLVYVDQLFTVSHTTHRELGIPAAKVIDSGAPLFFESAPLPSGRSGVPKKISQLSYQDALVYLGGYDIRKNVPLLVQTFLTVNKNLKPPLRLILIGEPLAHSRYYPTIPEGSNVVQIGTQSDETIYKILHNAFAFLHFSDSEGFNIPLLQALLAGTPALVRDIPANREISKGSALFLPLNKSALVKKLRVGIKLLQNPAYRKKLIANQKKSARAHSWKKSAAILFRTLNSKL